MGGGFMIARWLLVLVLVSAHAAAGAAARPASATADKHRGWRDRAADALIAHADADSLATAAALRIDAQLAARASELAPQDPGIGWLHLRLCADTPACDVRDVATVMRWVDEDNGAAWLPTLAAAQKDRDTIEVDRVLADMARGKRFDVYLNRVAVLMFDALAAARHDLPAGAAASDFTRLNTVLGVVAGEVEPPFAPLVDACRGLGGAAERRELCLKLAKTMQRGDTVVTQMAGFSIERHLVTPDSREARVIGERRHVLEWRVAEAAKFDAPLLPWLKNARARARLAQMRARPREEDVCIAILKQHKMAIDPPETHP